MANPTLTDLAAMVLVEADLMAGQIDDVDNKRRLNEELAALWELLLESWEGWSATEATVTILAGQDSVAVPADFYRPIDVTDSASGTPRSLLTFEYLDRHRVTTKSWCVNAGLLMVRPTSVAPGAYTLTYQPAWTNMGDSDTVAFPNNWHMLAVLTVAARYRGDQELATSELEARAKAVHDRIIAGTKRRKGRRKVRDVRLGDFPRRRSDPRDWTSD